MKDSLYDKLGVEPTASKSDIRKAYRKKAAKFHPDVNKNSEAEKEFKEVCKAYMILYDDTSRWKYDKTGEEENPNDRKPINYEEQAKTVLYRVVFSAIDKLGDSLNKRNLQNVARETAESILKEVKDRLANNKDLLKASKEKRDAIIVKQINVDKDSLLYKILETKIKTIETQEILPYRETRKSLLVDKKTLMKVMKLIETECKDNTKDQEIDLMRQWDSMMDSAWEDPRNSSKGVFTWTRK